MILVKSKSLSLIQAVKIMKTLRFPGARKAFSSGLFFILCWMLSFDQRLILIILVLIILILIIMSML